MIGGGRYTPAIRHDLTMNPRSSRLAAAAVLACLAAAVNGCLSVQAGDLFLLTRAGAGRQLSLLVSDGGTVRCDGGAAEPLPDNLLLRARDLANSLDNDAKNHLRLPPAANTVSTYTVRLKDGTISFPDTAARTHSELGQLELLSVQIAQGPCGLSG
jgi:hypothetical protein